MLGVNVVLIVVMVKNNIEHEWLEAKVMKYCGFSGMNSDQIVRV